jgi:hypothetical protein
VGDARISSAAWSGAAARQDGSTVASLAKLKDQQQHQALIMAKAEMKVSAKNQTSGLMPG